MSILFPIVYFWFLTEPNSVYPDRRPAPALKGGALAKKKVKVNFKNRVYRVPFQPVRGDTGGLRGRFVSPVLTRNQRGSPCDGMRKGLIPFSFKNLGFYSILE